MAFKDRLREFFKREKTRDFLVVFLAAFAVFAAVDLSRKGLDPFDLQGRSGDCYYYYKNADLFKKAWTEPFRYFPGLLFDSLSPQELQEIGFNHQSDFDTFFRAPTYIAFLGLWLAVFGASPVSGVLSQVFLLALLFGLIYLTVRLTAGRLAGFAAAALSLLYLCWFVFGFYALTEIFQAVALLALFCYGHHVLSLEKPGIGRYFLLALLISVFCYSKLSLKYAGALFVILFVWMLVRTYAPRGRKVVARNLFAFLVPMLGLFLLAGMVLSRGNVEKTSNNIQGWRVFHAGSCWYADGFTVNTGFHGKEFRDHLGDGKDQFWFIRYSEVCKGAVLGYVKAHPLAYTSMVLKRDLFLLLSPPFNLESISLFRGLRGAPLSVFQALLFFLSLAALFFLDRRYLYHKVVFLITAVYSALIYGMANPDSRFMAVLSPFLLVLPVLLAAETLKKERIEALRALSRSPSAWIALFTAVLSLVLMNRRILASFLPDTGLILAARYLLFLVLVAMTVLAVRRTWSGLSAAEKIVPAVAGSLVFLMFTAALIDDRHAGRFDFQSRKTVRTEIVLPAGALAGQTRAYLAFDVSCLRGCGTLDFTLNGRPFSVPALRSVTNEHFADVLPEYAPHWVYAPVDLRLLKGTNTVETVSDPAGTRLGYGLKAGPRLMPSFFHYVQNMGELGAGPGSRRDRRIYLPMEVSSSRRTTFLDGKAAAADADIFILLRSEADWWTPRQYAEVATANMKYIALTDPVRSGLAVWHERDPGPAWQKAGGNLWLYLAGEMDRFRSGFSVH